MKKRRPIQVFPYEKLDGADLFLDAVYESVGTRFSGEPLSKLFEGVRNLGGFRAAGRGVDKKFVILYTSGENKDWPDRLDLNTGRLVYYGDNRKPGRDIHDEKCIGNVILKRVFDLLHSIPLGRKNIPPFFVFQKYPTLSGPRSVQFKGLAVPGFAGVSSTADLVAVWKTAERQRFQNYQAIFTVLDVPVVARAWLDDLLAGNALTENAPDVYLEWVRTGRYRALISENTTVVRSYEEQAPEPSKAAILKTVWEHFEKAPREFEFFAARLFQMHDQRVVVDEVTRASGDGGRDAIGRYLLGLRDDPVYMEFSLEAKCYRPPLNRQKPNVVGVKEVSRLISRLRNRQFGVLVTTSVVAKGVYEEVRTDRHPVIFFCGGDIVKILMTNGFNTPALVKTMLEEKFPVKW